MNKIYVVTHKVLNENSTDLRQLFKVGQHIDDLQYINDDTGINISNKNPFYCELTALYWIWKNSNEDVVGLEHYRRRFAEKITITNYIFLSSKKIDKILSEYDMIIPKMKKLSITPYEQYKKGDGVNHYINDLEMLENIIKNDYPYIYDSFKKYFYKKNKSAMFNMFVCKKYIIDEYCEWLFDVFLKLENKIDYASRTGNLKRVFGYLSERLFNVWIIHKNIKYKECRVAFLEEKPYKRFIKNMLLFWR